MLKSLIAFPACPKKVQSGSEVLKHADMKRDFQGLPTITSHEAKGSQII